LPAIAAKIATLDSSVMGDTITNQRKIQNRKRVSRGSVLLCELCAFASLRETLFLSVDNSRKGAKPAKAKPQSKQPGKTQATSVAANDQLECE